MGKLNGKVAFVTGSNGGIGFAIAKLFAEEGAHVYVNGRRRELVEAAAVKIGPRATAVTADVSKPADLARVYDQIKAEHGRVDVVVANAAVGKNMPLSSIDEASYQAVFDVNVKGVIFTVQKALPLLPDGASVVLIGSLIDSKGFPGETLYGASKTAVRSLARTWTSELKDRKIRVNLVTPGAFPTEGAEALWGGPEALAKQYELFAQMIPAGRAGELVEIARAVLFMASNDSSYVNGVELYVDGGFGQV